MNKREITKKLVETIKQSPYKQDIREVFLFGSYAYGHPTPKSDVDILIDFEPDSIITYFDLSDIQTDFEEATKTKVDLMTPNSISTFIRDDVLQKAEKIYAKE